jgi:catalase
MYSFSIQPLDFMLTAHQPQNHFAEIEQAAFSPSTMVPGIEPSADPSMHQSRISVKISLTIDSASSQDVQLPRCTALSPWG